MRVVMSVVIGLLVLTSAAFANEGFEAWGTPWYDMVIDDGYAVSYDNNWTSYDHAGCSGCSSGRSGGSCSHADSGCAGTGSSCGYSSWFDADDPGWDWAYE